MSIMEPDLNNTQDFANTSNEYSFNESAWMVDDYSGQDHPNPFDILYIKVTFIFLYSAVFTLCIIGNFLVIFVVLHQRKMRTTTNIFLSNLAVADLCVGIFCIIPNLLQYISPVWLLGQVMCKLLYFVQMMSYVASIMTLTFIAVERYFAILHPLRCKTWKRLWPLRVAVAAIWIMSAATGFPQLIYRDTLTTPNGESFCYVNGPEFNRYAYVVTNFVLWYIAPLIIIVTLYSKISMVLWNTSKLDRPCSNALRGWRRDKKIKYTYKPSKCPSNTTNCQTLHSDLRISKEDELADRSNNSSPRSSIDEGQKTMMSEGAPETLTNTMDNAHTDKANTTLVTAVSKKETSSRNKLLSFKDTVPPRKGSSARPNHLSPIGHELSCALQDIISDNTTATGVTLCDSSISVDMADGRDGQASTSENKAHTSTRLSSECRQLAMKIQRGLVSQTWTWNRSEAALRARRRVIRLLMTVAVSFAFCVLPYHIQMIINEWGTQHVTFAHIFKNQITSLIFYFNSALNPILYAFLSDNFRKSLKELLPCRCAHSTETPGKKLGTKPAEYCRNGNSPL